VALAEDLGLRFLELVPGLFRADLSHRRHDLLLNCFIIAGSRPALHLLLLLVLPEDERGVLDGLVAWVLCAIEATLPIRRSRPALLSSYEFLKVRLLNQLLLMLGGCLHALELLLQLRLLLDIFTELRHYVSVSMPSVRDHDLIVSY